MGIAAAAAGTTAAATAAAAAAAGTAAGSDNNTADINGTVLPQAFERPLSVLLVFELRLIKASGPLSQLLPLLLLLLLLLPSALKLSIALIPSVDTHMGTMTGSIMVGRDCVCLG